MYVKAGMAEEIVGQAQRVAAQGAFAAALDTLTAPVYVTDPEGVITYFNPACVPFAGRSPVPGRDRWCVTWKLFTEDGEPMPHEECPMAAAIRGRSPVRGQAAVAERPDGSRVTFVPYPTPLWDADGAFIGAVNLLVDVTPLRQAEALRAEADRCERLARGVNDTPAKLALRQLAEECRARAADLEAEMNDA